MNGTILFYNGVIFRDCELLEWDQSIEMDESKTDLLYSKYRISVASMLVSILGDDGITIPNEYSAAVNQSTIGCSLISPHENGTGPTMVDRWNRIRHFLERPRQDFWFAVNGTTGVARNQNDAPQDDFSNKNMLRVVLAATGVTETQIAAGNALDDPGTFGLGNIMGFESGKDTTIERKLVVDANNGPKPISVKIQRIDGGRAARVQFTIEICRPLYKYYSPSSDTRPVTDAGKTKGVISNRWSIKESIDEQWKTNISIEGTLRVADRRYKPDAMRLMTSTQLIPWAKLKGREFTTTADGLTLHYRYSMEEIGQAAPPKIVDWEGTYTEQADYSSKSYTSFHGKVIGHVAPPNGWTLAEYKVYMFDILMKIMASRFNLSSNQDNDLPGAPKEKTIKEFSIVESMNKPEVAVTAMLESKGNTIFDGLRMRVLSTLGNEISYGNAFEDYDAKWWPIPPAYCWDVKGYNEERLEFGSAWDQYYQVPLSEWHGKPRGLAVNHKQLGDRENDAEPDKIYLVDVESDPPALENIVSANTPGNFYWAGVQLTGGTSYIQVESECESARNEGTMVFPLSKPRPVSSYYSGGGSGGGPVPNETVSVVPIHAGVQTRTLRILCQRIGAWPKIPAPLPVIAANGVVETLMKQSVIPESPKPDKDGKTLSYVVHCEYKYAANRVGEFVRAPNDPRLSLPAGSDLIAIGTLIDPYRVT
jgi:hypothetical protein